MRYLVKIGELGRKIEFLEKQLAIIDENIVNLKNVQSSVIWEGKASASFFNEYDKYLSQLNVIEENTLNLLEYLTSYYDKYGERYSELRQKYARLNDEVKKYGNN